MSFVSLDVVARIALVVAIAFAAPPAATQIARFPVGEQVRGAVLSGQHVLVAVETREATRILRIGPSRRRPLLHLTRPLPPATAPEGFDRPHVRQSVVTDASRTHVAIVRDVTVWWTPSCYPSCRRPHRIDALFTALYFGTVTGALRRIVRVDHTERACAPVPAFVAVSGGTVAYAMRRRPSFDCVAPREQSTIVVRQGRRTVEIEVDAEVTSLALAGRYVAWSESRSGFCPCYGFVVRDWQGRRTTTRYRGLFRPAPDLHLRPDGTVALVASIMRKGCAGEEIAVVPRGQSRPRFLGVGASWLAGFANGRIVAFGAANCNGTALRIIVSDLRGRTQILRRVLTAPSALDFDGETAVYVLPEAVRSGRASPEILFRQLIR